MQITDLNTIPHFGFGQMRLPVIDGDTEKIDIPQVCRMVDAYMDRGFTYFDTAYPYHQGQSERAVKKALVDRYDRESFLLADKLPAWSLKKQEDVQAIFDEQLERTGAGYFDFYLLHSIEKKWYPVYNQYGCWDWAQRMKAEGKIRHFGFSYHDDAELLDQILTEHPEVEFVQLQLNYLDWENPVVQARRNYEVCRKHGVAVNVMEPVKGGTLANLPPEAQQLLDDSDSESNAAGLALRFARDLDGMMVILSGMSSDEQMKENLDEMADFKPLSDSERRTIDEITRVMLSKPTIGCTACRYCVDDCPKKIIIPELFRAANGAAMYGLGSREKSYYKAALTDGHGAAKDCIKCGRCETACPQHLPIRELLEKVSETFDQE